MTGTLEQFSDGRMTKITHPQITCYKVLQIFIVIRFKQWILSCLGQNTLAKSEVVPKTGMLEQLSDGRMTEITQP